MRTIERPACSCLPTLIVAALALAACSEDDTEGGSTQIVCGSGTSQTLSAGGKVEVTGDDAQDLAGAAVAAPAKASSAPVTIACAQDLVSSGQLALGPAVAFTPAGATWPASLRFTLPFKPARLPEGANAGSVVLLMRRKGQSQTLSLPLVNPLVDTAKGRVSFDLDELATFQVAISSKAGTRVKRRYTYRAIVGFSMGGGAAAVLGLRHPDKFDFIGPLGGEPGVNLIYFLAMMQDSILAGFCTADDEKAGTGKLGQLCPTIRKPLSEQHEILSTYEKLLYQKGQGVGLTLNRSLYMKGMRDILRAYGNPIYHNPKHPYLPPGIPQSHLAQGSSACTSPVKLSKLYDREFNPDGSRTVITFCDGTDSSALGLGVFDPALTQTQPTQIMLAVDLDGNGKRDSGEPVVVHAREPFKDVGTDGKADAQEAGYDAVKNPDPAGDNYHYLKNPAGAEGNFTYDAGEPYEDVGIDGVKGTCQVSSGSGCYDYGEGNGQFDWSPMARRWLAHDAYTLYGKLTEAQRGRLDIWFDGGIRDFLNAHISDNGFLGKLASSGEPVRLYESFKQLQGESTGSLFDFTKVNWSQVGKNVYVRYGNPVLSQSIVEQTGDGRHVGTAVQVINRTLTFFAFVQNRWPGGDRETKDIDVSSDNFKRNLTFKSPSTGQDRPFALFLPPGYYQAQNKSRTYPVIYFLHGYGQKPDDLIDLSAIFANYMVSPAILEANRFQKFIIVYVDGRCRPGGSPPLSATGDQCEQGTFYLDTPISGTTARMETLLLELMDHIDKSYRTKKAAEVEIAAY